MEKYNSRKDECCNCGCLLTATSYLGQFFVMDYAGNFYCTECDKVFEDGDECIFEPEFYEDDDEEEDE